MTDIAGKATFDAGSIDPSARAIVRPDLRLIGINAIVGNPPPAGSSTTPPLNCGMCIADV